MFNEASDSSSELESLALVQPDLFHGERHFNCPIKGLPFRLSSGMLTIQNVKQPLFCFAIDG